MKPIGTHNYYVYITTNKNKTVLYIGVTNNLAARMHQHQQHAKPFTHNSFAGKYNASHLIYYEHFEWIEQAIAREKELKGWRRVKKVNLINTVNPNWNFLNETLE
ncbi:MAG TPA: GIY-YIG nuclease family protein [Chitinophagaceae bacterium]|jgi:putative endonuclease|nr:GIY-YIG nuclease family protein [Chitinophagaceae bacterium]